LNGSLSPGTKRLLAKKAEREKALFIYRVHLNWITAACRLPGSALRVALALHFVAGLQKRSTGLKLGQTTLDRFCVPRKSGYRGLRSLEQAGLVRVYRHRGRCPLVDIVEVRKQSMPPNYITI
jgi:hypothetical protein